MPVLDHLPGRTFRQNEEDWLYFSGTAYLGIPHLKCFRTLLAQGMQRYGSNFGGSRASNMQLAVFAEAEQQLAKWIGCASTLTLSSGTLAGQLLLQILLKDGPLHFSPNAHPALQPSDAGNVLTTEGWVHLLREQAPTYGHCLQYVCSSVDPLRARKVSFDWLYSLPSNRNYRIIVDDSHGIGVLGPNGSGIRRELPCLPNVEYVIMASLAKACGLPGAFIGGSKQLLVRVAQHPLFTGASPLPPAYLYAFLRMGEVYRQQLFCLRSNISYLERHWPSTIAVRQQVAYPVFYCEGARLATRLEDRRILISSFPYPTDRDDLVNRIVLSALHRKQDLQQLVGALHHIGANP